MAGTPGRVVDVSDPRDRQRTHVCATRAQGFVERGGRSARHQVSPYRHDWGSVPGALAHVLGHPRSGALLVTSRLGEPALEMPYLPVSGERDRMGACATRSVACLVHPPGHFVPPSNAKTPPRRGHGVRHPPRCGP